MNIFYRIKLLLFEDRKFVSDLYSIVGFIPFSTSFYKIPFVHRGSSVPYKGALINNERLEYLGDAILDAVVADYLFKKYPNRSEGFLSQMRSKIVKRQHLHQLGIKIGLNHIADKYVNNIQQTKYFYGDVLEALIGAIYLKRNYRYAKKFIIKKLIRDNIDMESIEFTESDFKSRLIEWAQKTKKEIKFESNEEYPVYEKMPCFVCQVYIAGEAVGQGIGGSKKEAEQKAAGQAACNLGVVIENID